MGTIKYRNCIDLTEAENIKKRWQAYTEELYKKYLNDPDNHNGVITLLKPSILECEVKWALESITTNKASGCDGIPAELFLTLKDDAVKMLHSMCQKIWKTQQWSQDRKSLVFILIPKKGNAKKHSNYQIIALMSYGLCGRGRGWEDLGEWHWSMYNIMYETSRQSRFDARYWMLGAGALGWPRGMVWEGRREEGSGWKTHVYLWRIHFNI